MNQHVLFKLGSAPTHQMRSGVGASWHSILNAPTGHGGSAFGGQPPLLPAHEPLWKSIESYASQLKLSLIRLEFEWQQFEPEKGAYNWDSPEMQILDRICAWAQRNGADVLLQQQWGGINWNSFEAFRGDPAMETYSAPADLDAFTTGWMHLLDELYTRRGYTCIKWVNIINEPGYWWWHTPESYRILREEGDRERSKDLQYDYLNKACALVRKRLQIEHPSVRLMGPDETDMPVYERLANEAWFQNVDDIDFHSYNSIFDHCAPSTPYEYPIHERIDKLVARYCKEAHSADKGFYLTEVGSMTYGFGADNSAPGNELSAIKDTELLIRSLRAGIDGFSRWSFTNRGDIDGQWQLIDTWDIEHKNWKKEASPHRPAFDILGRAMSSVPKQAHIIPISIKGGTLDDSPHQRVWATCVQDPITQQARVIIINNSDESFEFTLESPELGNSTLNNTEWSLLPSWDDPALPLEKNIINPLCREGNLPARQLTILESHHSI
ncbi:hypothetical protein QEH59_10035 [Coraliomargarita sp. SDUM461004]|uniref:Glycoside hydrolase family 5 domain-containing protein n=1 Tax=Thalassobacterium sedimentorum TaxID=3041258 RepID=A0ABU1AIW9_9BACT|nr:hypothetical protein [Coraliomargarita sp. SDUM461004]MDQ8194765.1 hypothetical protein [Coraliomargarita sp. SDUM461004]